MSSEWSDALKAHKARYRDRIIDAAIDLVAEEGVTKASMAGLAQRADIGRATVYKYFPDVEHALLAHVAREIDECAERIEAACAEQTNLIDRIHAYVQAMIEHFAGSRHRLGWATLDQAELSSAAMLSVRDHITRLHLALAELLTEGVKDGTLRPDLDPDLNARLIVKVLGSMRDDLFADGMTAEKATQTVWRLLTLGILGDATARPTGR